MVPLDGNKEKKKPHLEGEQVEIIGLLNQKKKVKH